MLCGVYVYVRFNRNEDNVPHRVSQKQKESVPELIASFSHHAADRVREKDTLKRCIIAIMLTAEGRHDRGASHR